MLTLLTEQFDNFLIVYQPALSRLIARTMGIVELDRAGKIWYFPTLLLNELEHF